MNFPRPATVALAALLSLLSGAAAVVVALVTLTGGHGVFSWQIAGLLLGYGVLQGLCGWGLWGRKRWSRGPAVALALLNLLVAVEGLAAQPAMIAVLVVSLAIVVLLVLPASTAALRQ